MKDLKMVLERKVVGGIVKVTRGAHKGKIGYWDDEDFDESLSRPVLKAVVYFGTPLVDDYYLIPFGYLQPCNEKHLPTEKLRKEKPEMCRHMGI